MDREDVTNLTGISELLNREKVDQKLNLPLMETKFINDADLTVRVQIDPSAEYNRILQESGLAVDETDDSEIMPRYEEPRAPQGRAPQWASGPPPPLRQMPGPSYSQSDLPPPLRDVQRPVPPPRQMPAAPNGYNPNYGHNQGYGGQYDSSRGYQPDPGRDFERGAAMYGGAVGIEDDEVMENLEEQKAAMLMDLEELLEELTNQERDISKIPIVNEDSTFEQVKRAHSAARRKFDFARGSTFGNDLIIAAAQGLGEYFDGTRSIGPFKPVLTGWHNTLRPKLRRMRYETARTVSNILTHYDIGPGMRMAIELIPSAVLYSNAHSKAKINTETTANAFADIRDLDE